MTGDQAGAVEISLIVVADDRIHTRDLFASLSAGLHRYKLFEISSRETMDREFDAAVEDSRGKRPVIVFLDCEFLRRRTEMFALRVRDLKRSMAIECVALCPPKESHRRRRLSELGLTIFDGSEPTAEGFLPH